jgi:hypothetical protein
MNWSGNHMMTKAVWSTVTTAAAVALFSLLGATTASAQTQATGSLNVSVNVAGRASLALASASISFADADPDTTPTLTSSGLGVTVKARTTAGSTVSLTVLATGDLSAGAGVNIPVNTLTWSTASAGFVNGAGNVATAQSVGSWSGSGARVGTLVFSLPNSWSYATGTYTTTLNYTLSVP